MCLPMHLLLSPRYSPLILMPDPSSLSSDLQYQPLQHISFPSVCVFDAEAHERAQEG